MAVELGVTGKVYIHELIDVIGHNRARYMHHMTANWCPVAREERAQLCLGVWATLGSTGRWPEVVNMWELDGWDGLAANFAHETEGGRDQDPSLAQWWAVAASLRRGGLDRIVVPTAWTRSVEQLIADSVRGEVYAHELITVPAGTSGELLDAVAREGLQEVGALGLEPVGAYSVAMADDTEALLLWAIPDWPTWVTYERAWAPDGALAAWRKTLLGLGARWKRQLLIDSPLNPLRTGRQPQASDRRPLDDV
ncbi:MAG: NIPSNAP family containing protein [Acidimicrobiales bacterium]